MKHISEIITDGFIDDMVRQATRGFEQSQYDQKQLCIIETGLDGDQQNQVNSSEKACDLSTNQSPLRHNRKTGSDASYCTGDRAEGKQQSLPL